MNPVLILTHNCLELTKRCIASVERQDIPTELMVIDNDSTDGTREWLRESGIEHISYPQNRGVSVGWNDGLHILFAKGAEHVLVIGNDTFLTAPFYRLLLGLELPFVTGVAVGNMEQLYQPPTITPLEPRPDFSAFLIRKECWETVGTFDERMKSYAGDCDFHIRAHRLGVPLWKAAIPFYHERSSTVRLAPVDEQQEIYLQAHNDRMFFKSVYGCVPGDEQYENIFK